jgi:Protein of unknown function (DUF2917)
MMYESLTGDHLMNISSQTRKIELLLKKHQLLSLNEAQPKMAIECKDGVIWVTHSGEGQDYMLRAGRRYVPKTAGSVVIEALDDACVDIVEQ